MAAPPTEDTILRSDPSTLPPGLRELFARGPLPGGATFYEERIDPGSTSTLFRGGMGLVLAGIAVTLLGPKLLPDGSLFGFAGLALILSGGTLLYRIRPRRRLLSYQNNGFRIQQGVYISGGWTVIRTRDEVVAVPRQCFIAIDGQRLAFRYRDRPKAVLLPAAYVGVVEPGIVARAIEAWASA